MKAVRNGMHLAVLLALGVSAVCEGQGMVQFRGPDSGLLYDPPTQSLRSIAGLIGAARVGEAVVEGIDWASVAPSGKLALFRKGGGLLVFGGANGVTAVTAAPGEAPDEVLWGADSRQALLLWTRGKSAQRIDIDGSGAATAGAMEALSLEGEITAIAGTPSGPIVAAVAGSGLFAVDLTTATARLLLPMPSCKALGVNGDGSVVWAVDAEHGVLSRIAARGDETPAVALTDPERLREVSQVAMAPNGKDLLLANPETRKLYLLAAEAGGLSELATLDGPVSFLRPMGRNSLFLLGHRRTVGESVQLYDDLRGDTVFVPFLGGKQ